MRKKRTQARSGTELRKHVLSEHAIDSAAALALLDVLTTAYDQALMAEAQIAREGLTVQGSRGPRPHPAVSISRDARNRMIGALRALKLEL
jgi:phage terminase small subunit